MMATLTESIGKATLKHVDYVGGLSIQFWAAVRALGATLPVTGNRYRWKASIGQMLQIGVEAVPMVALMAVCAGFILAMQGASELRRFGALHYVIDLVAVGFTREMGPLLTAIAVSGRSGSAFSAEIGTMMVTEEVDPRLLPFLIAQVPAGAMGEPEHIAALALHLCSDEASYTTGQVVSPNGGLYT